MKTCSPDLILTDLSNEIPEAPVAVIDRALKRAVRKMMVACLYEQWITIPTQHNVQTYPFEAYLPKGYGVQYVNEVSYNGCCIEPIKDNCQLCPTGYSVDGLTQITLHGYTPQSDNLKDKHSNDQLKVRVVLRMTSDNCDIPCDLIERFDEEIMYGALAHLLLMLNMPWSSIELGQFYDNKFQAGIASLKCLSAMGFNNKEARMEPECLL